MLTPVQLIQRECLNRIADTAIEDEFDSDMFHGPWDTPEAIEVATEYLEENHSDILQDQMSEIREGTHETGLDVDSGRDYESKGVAMLCGDQWVGWIYYYGGGKHGYPEAIEWLADAYFLTVREETRIVYVFEKQELEND